MFSLAEQPASSSLFASEKDLVAMTAPARPVKQSPSVVPRRRLELHNHQIDQGVAATHRCGNTHLPTGRVCLLPERHPGGCYFTERASRA